MTVPIPIPLVLSKSHAADQHEADAIFDAWLELRSALAVAGFAPR